MKKYGQNVDKVDYNKVIKLINLIYKAGYYKKPEKTVNRKVKVQLEVEKPYSEMPKSSRR
jgi:hypothetical protein